MILSLKEKFGVRLCDAEGFNAPFSDQETIEAASEYCNNTSNKEVISTTLSEKVGAQVPTFMINPTYDRSLEKRRKGKVLNFKNTNFKYTKIVRVVLILILFFVFYKRLSFFFVKKKR